MCGTEGVAGTFEDDGFGHVEFGQGRGVIESQREQLEGAGVGWDGVERVSKVEGEVVVCPEQDGGRGDGSYFRESVCTFALWSKNGPSLDNVESFSSFEIMSSTISPTAVIFCWSE